MGMFAAIANAVVEVFDTTTILVGITQDLATVAKCSTNRWALTATYEDKYLVNELQNKALTKAAKTIFTDRKVVTDKLNTAELKEMQSILEELTAKQ